MFNKKFFTIFSIIITVIVMGTIAVVLATQKSSQPSQLIGGNSQNQPEQVTPSVVDNGNGAIKFDKVLSSEEAQKVIKDIDIDGTPDELEWLTYINEDHGFELRYPEAFFIDSVKSLRFSMLEDFSQGLPIISLGTRTSFIDDFPDHNNTPWMSLSKVIEEQRKIDELDFNEREIFFKSTNGVKGFTKFNCFRHDGVGISSESIFFTPSSRVEIRLFDKRPEWQNLTREQVNTFLQKDCKEIIRKIIIGEDSSEVAVKMYAIRDKVIESIKLINK